MSRALIKKAEALLQGEKGTVFKDPGGRLSIALVYPNTYHVGMSSLGFQGIYSLLNERADTVCERAFLPEPDGIDEHERTGVKLFTLESARPLLSFDVVAFSISFENDYVNVLRILKLAKIPPLREDRERAPLVIAGGVAVTANPEPMADFFDMVFIGEAEETLHRFIDTLKEDRGDIHEKAAAVGGVYVPALYDVSYGAGGLIKNRTPRPGAPAQVKRSIVGDLTSSPVRHSVVTDATEFSGMYLIEAMRGCPWECAFCLAGHIYGPPRRKPLEAIKKEISEAQKLTSKIGLIGPSLTDYPHAEEVLKIKGVDFSITSLRASEKSARLSSLIEGRRSVSIAPEAGTERLRDVINKKITEDDILKTSALLLEGGTENLRLYFMLGLPTETDEDVDGIVALTKKIRALSHKGKIVLSISTFVPKAFTPFQWHPMAGIDVIKSRLKAIKKGLTAEHGVRVFHDVPKYAHMQGLFSMGGRRVGKVLLNMLETPDWRKAAKDAGIDAKFYNMRQKDISETLPWDFIDAGLDKEKLWERYQKAVKTNGRLPAMRILQPTEEDGYMIVARDLLQGVEKLCDLQDIHPRSCALIAAHSLECALKAFLRHKGVPEKEIRELETRHGLNILWEMAYDNGLNIPKEPLSWVRILSSGHGPPFYFRYQMGEDKTIVHGGQTPDLIPMKVELKKLIEKVEFALKS